MTDINEVVAELDTAAKFIYDQITVPADAMPLEDLVAAEDALKQLEKAIRDAKTLVTTAQCNQLEAGSKQIGTRVFARVPKRVERYTHSRIKTAIRDAAKEAAIDPETGEFRVDVAVDKAVELTFSMYASESTKGKITQVRALGLEKRDVVTVERNGFEVKVIETDPNDDDDE